MKSLDKEWFSAKELENLELDGLPKQATNITRKALNENWLKKDASGVKGGGYEYHISSFPEKTIRSMHLKLGLEPINNTMLLDAGVISGASERMQKELEGITMIDSYESINVSAGFGSFNDGVTEPDGKEPYSDGLLASLGVKAHHCAVFWASGNSMQPTIDNGDQLLVDLSRKEVKGDKVYLVQNGDSVWVKLVRLEWDYVELISDNKEYRPIQISSEEAQNLQIIGQVVYVGHKLI